MIAYHEDSSLAAIENQVASGELLAAKECTVLSTIEGQICHETTRAIVHEDSNLRI